VSVTPKGQLNVNYTPQPISDLEKKLGVTFSNIALLHEAITHKSYAKLKSNKGMHHNERLEFLGDAVLKLIVSNYLYNTHRDKTEGFMTKVRSKLVSDSILAQFATQIDLGSYMQFSYGEFQSGGAKRPSNLANAFEAVLGAIYQDQGYKSAENVFMRFYLPMKIELETERYFFDYKSVLQEWSQSKMGNIPIYTLIQREGPDHDSIFHVEVKIISDTNVYHAIGVSRSKKSAEQAAAKVLLTQLKIQIL
jgi:ribonuclease-3